MLFYLLRKFLMRGIVLCHDKETAGVLVYTVDDAGPYLAVYTGERTFAVEQERVYKRAVRISRRRMNHHTLRLVYDEQIIVLIKDIERYVLGLCLNFSRLGN